ncbi:MAG: beta-ketoacyl-[acyl-carrier-protein] synthase family protein [Nitrospirales bacterium]|nr:beta-ketoacyl-[acyl-carrier-protein] synthase family protein [Nitrospirales bacterium]
MIPLALSHATIVTALGKGVQAHLSALQNSHSGLRPCSFEGVTLDTNMGEVEGLNSVALATNLRHFDCRNNRLALLGLAQDGFEESIAQARRRYGGNRIGVFIGTSTSGILETEHAYQQRDPKTGVLSSEFLHKYRYTQNTFSVADFVRTQLQLTGPAFVISTACASSAKVFASAARFIQAGVCDAAVVGGVDSLCLTTLYGFSALQLTSPLPCRPCDQDRDGLTIGEGAAFLFLEKFPMSGSTRRMGLLGYGESCDAHHMSHPHPTGQGAVLAMEQALASSALRTSDIDYIHLHGTATRANDQTEDQAITSLFGTHTPCSSTKGWTGHTLGAAGGVEAVIGLLCLQHQYLPGTLNTNVIDPAFSCQVLLKNEERPIRRLLSNFFGFGGNNCSLVLGFPR